VNWFRKGTDGKFVWPGYGENMRILKWMLERVDGPGQGIENIFGITPRYSDITWTGLNFTAQQYEQVTHIDSTEWKAELQLHTELFTQLAHHLPCALTQVQSSLQARLSKD
jgi:phosphoenolpyruvate carboxykinase (GTP)